MNYQECLAYLDRLGNEVLTMKFGLETIRTLLEALGNPQRQYDTVLIAGTNGKGSVARFLHSVLTACSIRSALYTSPHLVRLEERLAVNGRFIEPHVWARHFSRVVHAIQRLNLSSHPTYFETLTATAFLYFAEQKVEIAVLEVGMGGRLDSTNVVDPVLSMLTPIGLDHQQYLGATLEAIAFEKAGILRPGVPALLAPQSEQVRNVLLAEAAARGAAVVELEPTEIEWLGHREGRYRFAFHGLECRLQLYGAHQVENAALAILAAERLRAAGFPLLPAGIEKGVSETNWMGRLQKVCDRPAVFLDGAHNLDAAQSLVRFLGTHTQPPRSLVFGVMRDKDITGILEILQPSFERIYLTQISSPRAAGMQELQQMFPPGIPIPEPMVAYQQALNSTATVMVAGSFYLVGEVLRQLRKARSQKPEVRSQNEHETGQEL